MEKQLRQSYRYCSRIAKRAASSFYWSFYLLSPAKRKAMFALYAFMRHTDDLSDSVAPSIQRRQELESWREALDAALTSDTSHPILTAVADTVRRYNIPREYLFDVIDGVATDLEPKPFETFDQLADYCYHVASVVGLACIHIWGFKGKEPRGPAIQCGVAFQMTNILRDLDEDAQRGRVYLPQEDLRQFQYSTDDLKERVVDSRFGELMNFEIRRTEMLYAEAASLIPRLSRDGRRIVKVMISTYASILREIKQRDGDVFSRPIRLGWRRKLLAVAAAFLIPPAYRSSPAAREGVAQVNSPHISAAKRVAEESSVGGTPQRSAAKDF